MLKSAEVDILEDGTLDLPDDVLKELDLTVCAVHSDSGCPRPSRPSGSSAPWTIRYFNILAHPTGRLIGERDAYAVDLEKVMEAAKERGCFLEVNAQPERLDLDDTHCRQAKEMGVKLAVSTDAHDPNLALMTFGVDQARRGWIETADVLNTRPLATLRSLLRRT